jgi:FkbM family methyltransferase
VRKPLSKIYAKIKNKFFPSIFTKEVRRWYLDGGDRRLRFNYELMPDSIVFDLGGFEGDFASDLYSKMPCRIYSFEPIKSYAADIVNRFRLNPDISVFNYGLSCSDQTVDISIDGPGSSVHRTSFGTTEQIVLRDITKVMLELNVDKIDLLKINIEGGEYDVLPKIIDANLLPRIANLQIQFHEIDSDSLAKKDRIRKMLELTHDCVYCYEFVWEDWRIKGSL